MPHENASSNQNTTSEAGAAAERAGADRPQWKLHWGLAAAVGLSFASFFGLGYYVSSAASAGEQTQNEAAPRSIVYKIPVSMAQATLGPDDALVTLVQWCDLPDPACSAAEPAVQALLKRHKSELRLVFRHFAQAPQTRVHQFSRFAHETAGKFWEARALLFAHRGEVSDADLERYAGQLGLDWAAARRALDAGTYSGPIAADRLFARMFDVKGPAAFFANGRPLSGPPTEQALEQLIGEELVRAKQVVAKGVQKKDVYAELTKNGVWTPLPRPTAQ